MAIVYESTPLCSSPRGAYMVPVHDIPVEHEWGYLLTDLCFWFIVFLWIMLCTIVLNISSLLDGVTGLLCFA